MAFKLIVLCAALAVANAGYLGAPAAIAPGPAIGVAYSAAPAVSTVSYSSPLVSYGAPLAAPAYAAPAYAAPAYAASAYAAPAYAGAAYAAPAITSQHSNILRSFGNLGQVSTYSKTIDTPFSSVQKSDVRVSNPGVRFAAAAPLAYAAPAIAHAPAIAAPAAIGVAYSAAPAVSHFNYAGSYGLNYGW